MNDLMNRLRGGVQPKIWECGETAISAGPDIAKANSAMAEAADHIEAQNKLIEELASELANGIDLLEIIKEHWIDYDHIYSIFVHEAKELASKVLSKSNPNTPERNDE